MKQEYVESIEKLIEACEDIDILNLVFQILKKTTE